MPGIDRPGFVEALRLRPILLDAAMGTRLIARGLDLVSDDPSLWVLDHPEVVFQVHRLDARAGSEALLTNTFGANRAWLDRLGRADQVRSINRRAVELARDAIGPVGYVIGSIGPTASDHPTALIEQVEALSDAGVDALLLETHRLDRAEATLRLLRGSRTPIIASLVHWPEPIEESAHRLLDAEAIAIGGNCLDGMVHALDLARKLHRACDDPLFLKPSAGRPGWFVESPGAFGAAVSELIGLGVRLLGGCCGSTEAHVASMRAGLGPIIEPARP